MNDLDINKAVAEKLGHETEVYEEGLYVIIHPKPFKSCKGIDYCNNWSDGGPIIEKYKISMQFNPFFGNGYWNAFVQNDLVEGGKSIEMSGKFLLRCAMLCFLEMEI